MRSFLKFHHHFLLTQIDGGRCVDKISDDVSGPSCLISPTNLGSQSILGLLAIMVSMRSQSTFMATAEGSESM